MIDVNGIEWNWFLSVVWWLFPVLVFLVLGVISNTIFPRIEIIAEVFFVLAPLWLLIGGIISMTFVPAFSIEAQENQIIEKQLEQQGFADIDLDRDTFTANKNGQYFIGMFYSLGDNQYKVVEVPLD